VLLAIELLKERRRVVHVVLEAREVVKLTVDDDDPGFTAVLLRGLNQARRQAQAQERSRQRIDLQPKQYGCVGAAKKMLGVQLTTPPNRLL
jgi:hypothetical protein